MEQLVKLGINEELLSNAFDILDMDRSGCFDREEFLTMIIKLLHPPQSQDMLALHQKINQIMSHFDIVSSKSADMPNLPDHGGSDSMPQAVKPDESVPCHGLDAARKSNLAAPQQTTCSPPTASGFQETEEEHGILHPCKPLEQSVPFRILPVPSLVHEKGFESGSHQFKPLPEEFAKQEHSLVAAPQPQATETSGKLEQLTLSIEVIEDGLRFVHCLQDEAKADILARLASLTAKADVVLKDEGVCDVPEDEIAILLKEFES
eukprot:gnl/MRDRNA2_/MRDRNA2_176229_c0_seq1.p1 gnl/MRDRNA2_/MRDRNA2_176229_c0~~gnl/MRDRNA2_/MRDRNA2_176229_c0_seq1.p1  ORF type:complete len:300 (+),score=77.63 gnl/MRDRNA2_/MRDRNA2_176229_c0_seq1:112-900(+)